MYVTSMRCGLWDVLNAVEAIQDSIEGSELLAFPRCRGWAGARSVDAAARFLAEHQAIFDAAEEAEQTSRGAHAA